MKKVFLCFLFSFCFFLGFSQWTQTGGPEGGYIDEIVQLGNDLFVAANTGSVFKSDDNGNSWSKSDSGLPANSQILMLEVFDTDLYASVGQHGLYKSNDAGVTWYSINFGIENESFYSLYVDGNNIFAGRANGGITYSNDGGTTYEYVGNGISDFQFSDFVTYNGKVYAASGNYQSGLYESDDKGATWSKIENIGNGPNGVHSIAILNGTFVISSSNGIYYSSDNLVTWSSSFPFGFQGVNGLVVYDNNIYAPTSSGSYYYTSDVTADWTLVQNPFGSTELANDLLVLDNDIFISTSEGLFKSTDSGANWAYGNNGIRALSISTILSSNDKLYAGSNGQGIYQSIDNGLTWTKKSNGLSTIISKSIYEILEIDNSLHAATGNGIYSSLDNGNTWVLKFDPGLNQEFSRPVTAMAFDNDIFVASSFGKSIHLSMDDAETWNELTIDILTENTDFQDIAIKDDTIIVNTGSETYISTNLGVSWSSIPITSGSYYVYNLEIVNSKFYAATNRGLYTSEDQGESWELLHGKNFVIWDLVVDSNIIYAASNQGLYITSEDHDKWYELINGFTAREISSLALTDETIFGGTFGSSIWELSVNQALAVLPDTQNDFALRINTGGVEVDYNGETFITDTYFDTGRILDRPQTGLSEPFQTFRYSRSQQIAYDIPLEDGKYTVNLYFAELYFGATGGGSGGVGSRVFDVSIEGQLAEDNLDVFAEAGADAMLMKSHIVTVTGGVLNIDFDSRDAVGGKRHPIINAIEILGKVSEPLERPFVTTWKTDNPGTSEDNQITIPTFPGETYNYSVKWGDGTSTVGETGNAIHTYSIPGTYEVSISGEFPGTIFLGNNDSEKLLLINQWGDIKWSSMASAFATCNNLDVVATDVPGLEMVSDMRSMFLNCTSLVGNSSFNNWDLTNVSMISGIFNGATLFNQTLNQWDVRMVEDMSWVFNRAFSFNQPIDNWDVSKVKKMFSMFGGARSFNHPLPSWDVSSVTDMTGMFYQATAFNQNLESWNISNVTTMSEMLKDVVLSTENYDSTLIGWSGLPLLNVITFDGGNSQYCEGEAARQKLIDDFGWIITDGGKTADCPDPSDFALRINTGGTVVDYSGETYIVDNYFDGGSTLDRPQTGLPEPYQTFRYSRSQQMAYDIPMEDGEYTINLHFAELWFGATGGGSGGVGSRVFDVTIEGQLAEDNLDVFAEVGAEAMLIKSHTATVTGGVLNIDFDSRDAVGGERHPIINAIEILGKVSEPEQRPFVTTWKTDNPGASEDNQITIPTFPGETYNYHVDWGDGTSDSGVSGDIIHTYVSAGTYQVSISGEFPRIYFNNLYNYDEEGNEQKLVSIEQWGDIKWSSMNNAFAGCLNMDLDTVDIPDLNNLTDLDRMFAGCYLFTGNATMENWDVSGILTMSGMFIANQDFNAPIGDWDTSNVTDLSSMFLNAKLFNQDISTWNTGNVTRLDFTFSGAEIFNQDIGQWDVSNVVRLDGTFSEAQAFNQDIGDWNVSKAEVMFEMFSDTRLFDQDLSRWNVEQLQEASSMFYNSGLSNANYDKLLIGWSQLPLLQQNVQFHADQNLYCDGAEAREFLIDNYNWIIGDAGKAADCPDTTSFITTWKTDNPGISEDNQITIPTHPDEIYDYTINWGDGTSDSGVGGDITHTYTTPGTYHVSISGNFPRIYFNSISTWGIFGDEQKILSIDQWGDVMWSSMANSFRGCINVDMLATDIPDFTNTISLDYMFNECHSLVANESLNSWNVSTIVSMEHTFSEVPLFNIDISGWDVSNVERMFATFFEAQSFNQDMDNWDVSNVKTFAYMFSGANDFNQDLSSWQVNNASDMQSMFAGASSFNKDIGNWNVDQMFNLYKMFKEASSFNQDLSNWNVSNVTLMEEMYSNSGLSNENYDKILIGWSQLPSLQIGVELGANNNEYCLGEEARQKLIDDFGWTIDDAGKAADCPEPNDFALRINTGGAGVDYNGETFVGDTYFNTGRTLDRPQTGLPEPYQTFRYSRSQQMSYDIPIPDGEYTVNLYFAELYFGATGGGSGGVGKRVFDVNIEGALAEDNLDIFAEVGAETMLIKTHTVNVTGGVLDIDFDSRDEVGGERHPVINAIEILGANGSGSGKSAIGKIQEDNTMSIYPNQATTFATVSLEKPIEVQQIMVFDMIGRLIQSYDPREIGNGGTYTIDVNSYQQGPYIIKMIDNKGANFQKQMVVKR